MIVMRRVVGQSMAPALAEGQFVVALSGHYKEGQIVIALVKDKEVIKRIKTIVGDDYYLLGDNLTASTDSRSYGPIGAVSILGRVIFKI